jgi:very-short-patch-repair endonuclease
MNCSPTSKKLCGKEECTTCYNRSFATHHRSEFWSQINELKPIQVHKCSNKKFWFNCEDCGHEIYIPLSRVYNGGWCIYCNKDGICELIECEFCYNRSFASHPMSSKWSLKNELNSRFVLKGSDKKFWFDCDKCNHSFESRLYSVNNDEHCPYCSNQKLCVSEDCTSCFNKSCASHEMALSWSSLNIETPRDIFLQSNKKFIFNCLRCYHQYETTSNHYYNRNGSCVYCDNKKLCDNIDCQICLNKSFASHQLVLYWSDKNNKSPREVFKGSESKYIFNCNVCKSEFESKMYNVLTGYWCPYCKNKSEAKVLEFIKDNFDNYKSQLRFDWCRFSETNNIMPFDFGLIDKKILIELDGEQHFSQISNWDSPESVQQKDIEKINKCIQNGYSIIHIYQSEVWNDKYDWRQVLKDTIKELETNNNKICMFISMFDKYKTHMSQLDSNTIYKIVHPKI